MAQTIKQDLYVYKSTELGSEKVTNGGFASDLSGWTNNGGWAQAAGKCVHTVANDETLEQNVSVVEDEAYLVSITISDRTAGSIGVALGGDSGFLLGSNGSYSRVVRAITTGNLIITPTINFDGKIDDVSVKAITGGDIKASGQVTAATLKAMDIVKLPSYTVATLPAGGEAGDIAFCTDLTTPTFGGALTGGGAVKRIVMYDGSAWKS